jgi:hypothetical protein
MRRSLGVSCPVVEGSLSAPTMTDASRPDELTAASGTKRTASASISARLRAASSARPVLPTPPGPLSVSSRQAGSSSRCAMIASSLSRPTNDVAGAGSSACATMGGSPGAEGRDAAGARPGDDGSGGDIGGTSLPALMVSYSWVVSC